MISLNVRGNYKDFKVPLNLLLSIPGSRLHDTFSQPKLKLSKSQNFKIDRQQDLFDLLLRYLEEAREIGNLDLSNTPIQLLPDGLEVGGSLDLYNAPIQSLPDNLKVFKCYKIAINYDDKEYYKPILKSMR